MTIKDAQKEIVNNTLIIIENRIKDYSTFTNGEFRNEITALEVLKKIIKKEYKQLLK